MIELLPSPDLQTLVICVRAYDGNLFLASTPKQKFYRTASTSQGFESAAIALLERHYPDAHTAPVQVSPNDARVAALQMNHKRLDADSKETRWFISEVAVAD
jgi:hypothetical protein